MKKFLCVFISIIMCCSASLSASAAIVSSEINAVCEAIASEISLYESCKEVIGMENVDFSNLYISEKINVYEYSQAGFIPLSEAYVISENENIVSLAYRADQEHYQIMTYLAEKIADTSEKSFAIVYDQIGCYLYTGERFVLLCTSGETIETRKSISADPADDTAVLSISSAEGYRRLPYSGIMPLYDQTEFLCSINYVTQKPYDSICWAACTAMIVNRLNKTSYNAEEVAIAYWGGSNFNQALETSKVADFMKYRYNVIYAYMEQIPSDNCKLRNIKAGCPIYASLLSPGMSNHAVVIYGMNIIAGRIVIMDPMIGSQTCYSSSGNYRYVCPVNGHTYIIGKVICRVMK